MVCLNFLNLVGITRTTELFMELKRTLRNFIDKLENVQFSVWQWLATLLSIIFIRNFLESFSDINNYWRVLNFQSFFLHYPICIITIILIITIVLHLLSKERIEKVTKITILFSLIIWSVPVVDLILSLGTGFNISYLFGDFDSLSKQFITFFGRYTGEGASYSMKIEIGIVLLLLFLYIYLKTGRLFKSVLAPIIVYSFIFILGSLPSWIMILLNSLNYPNAASRFLESEMILNSFYSFDLKISIIWSILIIVILMVWFYLYDKNKFMCILKNVRVTRVMHYEAMLVLGMILGFTSFDYSDIIISPLSNLVIISALVSVFFAWLCAIGINDISDLNIDIISNRERPLICGIFNLDEYKNLTWIFFLLAILFGYLVRYSFMTLIIVFMVLAYLYSMKPLRLRRIPILSSFIIASASLIILMSGFLIFSQDKSLLQLPRSVIWLVLLVFTLAVNFKDIKDSEGDKKCGIVTIPTLLGKRKGKIVVGILVLFSYLSVPIILDIPQLFIFAVICGLASFWVINMKKMKELFFFLIYFAFLVPLIYYYLN